MDRPAKWTDWTLMGGSVGNILRLQIWYFYEPVTLSPWSRPLTTSEIPAPFCLHRETVRPEWIDYNGHMNVAYYILVFDHATDVVLDYVGLGANYRAASGCSVFVAEAHVTYDREVNAGDALRIASRVVAAEGKKFILYHEMFRADEGEVTATNEVLCVHVDLARRRGAPVPNDALERLKRIAEIHGRLPRAAGVGRAIALNAGRRPGGKDRP
jgi:acyl-CoA thioester hydrolase